MKKDKIKPTKSFLINMLYHVGFNEKGIKTLANASKQDINNSINNGDKYIENYIENYIKEYIAKYTETYIAKCTEK